MPTGNLRAAIVTLNYNGRPFLEQAVPSLVEAAKRARTPTTVHVLDNQSSDDSEAWVRKHHPEVTWADAESNRVLCSFNPYVADLEEEIVILLNNDITVEGDFVDPLVEVFRTDPDAFLAAPRCTSMRDGSYEGLRTRARLRGGIFWASCRYPGHEAGIETPSYTFASGMGAFRRDRFLALGGYDDLYLPGIMEDADLAFRAWRRGWTAHYVPASRIHHLGQASFHRDVGRRRTDVLAHRNGLLFLWKNIRDPMLWGEHLLLLPLRILFDLLRGRTVLAEAFGKALRHLPRALRRRECAAAARSDREIFDRSWREPPASTTQDPMQRLDNPPSKSKSNTGKNHLP